MGLLDDAIREHLDLKRRRGADPSEVERAEREALGPVRRNRDPGDMADAQEVSGTGGFAYDREGDEDWREAPNAATGADMPESYADYEDDEPEFDPIVPPEPVERTPLRPRSLSEPPDHVASPHDGEETAFYDPAEPSDTASDPRGDWAAADEDAFAAEPFPPVSAAPRRPASGAPRQPADAAGDETAEYRVEDALEPGDAEGEDMLEETPEFLQDTPDHDRLWFEQRPPRDFDFDG